MNNIDINVLLLILDYASADDVLSYCSSSSNLFRLCNKYSDVIWERLLWRDYKITKDQIIGKPKSYYFGLKNNKGYYYFYELDDIFDNNDDNIFTVKRLKLMSKEDSQWDDHFYVPGIDEPKGEKVIVGVAQRTLERYGSENTTVVGKTLNDVKKLLVDKINKKYIDFDIETIENVSLNITFKENITDEFNGVENNIKIQFFEATL